MGLIDYVDYASQILSINFPAVDILTFGFKQFVRACIAARSPCFDRRLSSCCPPFDPLNRRIPLLGIRKQRTDQADQLGRTEVD